MKILGLILIVISFGCSGDNPVEPATIEIPIGEPQFRKVRWGWSPEVVKAVESAEPAESSGDVLRYSETVSGNECVLEYHFEGGKLVAGRYVYIEKLDDPVFDGERAEDWQDALEEKYGDPIDEKVWIDPELMTPENINNRDAINRAPANGQATADMYWKTPDADIQMHYGGTDGNLNVYVEYTSPTPSQPVKEEDKL